MEINQTKTVRVQAKTLSMHIKISDRFSAVIKDENGNEIGGQEDGYVPGFMPGEHYGDYLILDIDLDTGTVTNWRVPTAEQIEAFMSAEDGD